MKVSELIELLSMVRGDPPVLVWSEGIGGNINLERDMIEYYAPKDAKESLIIDPQ